MQSHHIFLSHRHLDRRLADALRHWLEALPGVRCTVFQSSDAAVNPAGADWQAQIERHVRASDVVIALFGRTGGDARWDHINWECSEALALGKPVIPVCYGGVLVGDLHDRLRRFVALTVGAPGFGRDLVDSLAHRMPGLDAPAADVSALERALAQVAEQLPAESLRLRIPSLDIETYRRLADGFPPSILLHPHLGLLEFGGRAGELEELGGFCRHAAPFRWKVMCGEAGTGKTRLALEFSRRMGDHGWSAGFLEGDELDAFVASGRCDRWHPGRPTLIVVDYASSRLDLLRHLCRRAGDLAGQAGPASASVCVRLLLLERHADRDHGWLFELVSRGAMRHVLKAALDETLVLGRPPQHPGEDSIEYARRVLQATSDGWARVTGKSAPAFATLTDGELRLLQAHTLGRPLYLQMAAIRACEIGSYDDVARWNRSELLAAAVEREVDYIHQQHESHVHGLLLWATAVLCLTGSSIAHQPAWKTRLRDRLAEDGDPGIQPRHIHDALATLFAIDRPGRSRPIEPDLVAEAFVAHVLRHYPGEPLSLLGDALDLGGAEAWRSVLRLVQDLHGLSGYEAIDGWLEPVLRTRPNEELKDLAKVFPERTVSLRRLAIDLYRRLLGHSGPASVEPAEAIERAWWQSKLALHLHRAGRLHEAIVEARRAVAEWRYLAGTQNAGADGLAYALYVLDNCLVAGGQEAESLEVVRAAVDLRRRELPAHRSELAKCLNNLGLRLRNTDLTEAQRVLEEAVGLWRGLTAEDPATHAPELARSLNNLAGVLRSQGEAGQALPVIQESVAIREEFTARDPDANGTDLLFSLETYALILAQLQQSDRVQAAVDRYEAVARDLGSRDGRLLVDKLATLALLLQMAGRGARAVDVAGDSVAFARALDAGESGPPGCLGQALLRRAHLLGKHGRPQDALADLREAIRILEPYATSHPVQVLPVLGACWRSTMDHLRSDAPAWQEAAAKALWIGQSLTHLAGDLFRQDRSDESAVVAHQGVAAIEELSTRASGDVIRNALALGCNNRAYVLHRLGRNEEALAAARHSCEILEGLRDAAQARGARPDVSLLERIGESQETLAVTLLARGDLAAARAASERSIDAFDDALQRAPEDRMRLRRIECVLSKAEILAACGEHERAGQTLAQAVAFIIEADPATSRASRVRAREVALRMRTSGEIDHGTTRILDEVLSWDPVAGAT